jgi:hypothetical protein
VVEKYNAFVFYGCALIILLTAAALTADYSMFAVIGLYAGGLFSWVLLEYSLHRFIFHSDAEKRFVPKVFSASHLYHHRNPKDASDLVMDLTMSVPIAAGYYLLAWLIVGSWQVTAYLFFGLISARQSGTNYEAAVYGNCRNKLTASGSACRRRCAVF